jgi:tetratricopeptide (TPR) repeat protein
VLGRYRLVLVPVFIIYAAGGVLWFCDAVRQHRRLALVGAGLLPMWLFIEFVLVPIPDLRKNPFYVVHPVEYDFATKVYVDAGRYEEALREAHRLQLRARGFPAVEAHADELAGKTLIFWAADLLQHGRIVEAHATLDRAGEVLTTSPPADDDVWFNLGALAQRLEDTAEAQKYLRLYLSRQPTGKFSAVARQTLERIQ